MFFLCYVVFSQCYGRNGIGFVVGRKSAFLYNEISCIKSENIYVFSVIMNYDYVLWMVFSLLEVFGKIMDNFLIYYEHNIYYEMLTSELPSSMSIHILRKLIYSGINFFLFL